MYNLSLLAKPIGMSMKVQCTFIKITYNLHASFQTSDDFIVTTHYVPFEYGKEKE